MDDEEKALELEPKPTIIEDRPISDLPEYARVQVVQANEVSGMSMAGWVMVKAVPMDQLMHVNKTYPYVSSPGAYPSNHSYAEDVVLRTTAFLMGCPRTLVDAQYRAEIDRQQENCERTTCTFSAR